MEDGLCRRLVQVGIRTQTPHLKAQAARYGVEVFGPDRCDAVPIEALEGPVYVSLDLDGLDPAFAPGVSHPEPGGLSVRDVVRLLHRLRAPVAGGDVVEYNPANDTRDLTARVAAKLVKELAAVAMRNAGA
jgi:arginase family enzyme